jgi:hypothetical protein
MTESSHSRKRTPRPWTPQDQSYAEVAAACGSTFVDIGKILSRHPTTVRLKLLPATAGMAALEYGREWRLANREHLLERSKEYAAANKDRKRQYDRQRYLANRESVIEQAREYRNANPEKAAECKRLWYRQNRQRVANTVRRWKASNPERLRESLRQRKARKRAGRSVALEPLTKPAKEARFAIWKNQCAYCENVGAMTVDHVLPLVAGGLDEPSNIAPACASCNTSKNANPVESWYRRQPFFTEARWRKIQRHCPAAVAGQLPLALPG